jgi:hypothetical protein
MSNRERLQIAMRLYEMHETVRRLWPIDWRQRLEPTMQGVLGLAEAWQCDVIEVLPKLQKISAPSGTELLWLGAAVVELIEPSAERDLRIEDYQRQLAENNRQITQAQAEARQG